MANDPDDTVRETGRPRVIGHLATSLDGRIDVDGWPSAATFARRASGNDEP